MTISRIPAIREKAVLAACLQLLRMRGIFHLRNNTGATRIGGRYIRFGAPGSPDIIACINGVFVGIEVKRPGGGKLSEAQEAVQDALQRAGGTYLVVRDVSDLNTALKAI